ncbi:hypothetical protein [Micromonospora sp. URMC 103]|uniref:hypothetical protein n=1 Tax=Micromonospora sp. URMC 103 TaxID=3423406 RepID=UPI003F1D0551
MATIPADRAPDSTLAFLWEGYRFIGARMRYDVSPQDLAVSLRRMPTLPPSGFVVTNVRRTA